MKSVVLIYFLVVLVTLCHCKFHRKQYKNEIENKLRYRAMFNVTEKIIGEYIVGGPRLSGASTATSANFPWIMAVTELTKPTATNRGPAAIVGTKYAMMHASPAADIIEILDCILVSKTNTIGVFNGANAVVRRGRYIHFDVTTSPVSQQVAIIRFCPTVDASFLAPMPTTVGAYAVGTSVTYYNYLNAFSTATKALVAPATCNYPSLTPQSATFCAPSTGPIKIQTGDYKGTIAVINGKFAGINIAFSTGNSGELFADVRSQTAFIANPPAFG